MKRTILFLAVLTAVFGTAIAQSRIDSTALRALQMGKVMQQERVYMHFDNTAYYLGETMWFKAYVSYGDNLRPSRLSKVLYVELVAPEGYVVKTNKYKINDDGSCHGEFELNQLLLSGYYEVRAYTRYMLNWDKSAIFSRVFPVFDKVNADNWDFKNMLDRRRGFNKDGEWVSAELPEATLDFFPEGGNLVTGIKSRVAYELRGKDGLFAEEKITIYENNTRLLETKPVHMGKGTFTLTPKSGAEYRAEVTITDDKGKARKHKFKLPEASPEGAVMNIKEEGGRIKITIANNLEAGQELGFTLLNRGTMGYYHKFSSDSRNEELVFEKDSLYEGVNRAVLFISNSTPLAERQFFVEHDSIQGQDINTVKLHVTANGYHVHNASLTPNQRITLKVSREDGKPITEQSDISLAVRDAVANQETPYSHNMYTYMLLGSELRGFIPDAAQYFDPANKNRKEHLDLVMLTHGWSSYDWQLLTRPAIEKFQPVERGITLKGGFYRKSLDNRIGHKGEVVLLPQKFNLTRMDIATDGKSVETTTFRTDSTGGFVLEVPDFYGSRIASLKPQTVLRQQGNISYHFVLDRYYSPAFRLYDYWERHLGAPMSKSEADSLVNLNPFEYMLSSVEVVAKKNKETNSRPPHSEMRFNYLDEWEYANDITYMNVIDAAEDELYKALRDDALTDTVPYEESEIMNVELKAPDLPNSTKYIGSLRLSSDNPLNITVDHDYDHILTAEQVVSSAMRRHGYNWAYWVQLMVVLGEYDQDAVARPDKEYLKGVPDAEKMTNFKEIVIRSDEKTRQQFENRLTHWSPLSFMLDNKVPLQKFYRGFLSHSYLYAGEGIDGCPDIWTFYQRLSSGTGIDYPMNPNYVACLIPYTKEERSQGIVPEYISTGGTMRYTSVQGYSESKKFYSPDYSRMQPQEKDYRRTLLWEPDVKIENGEAIIELYNSSCCNNILVDVSGRIGNTIYSNDNITFTKETPEGIERQKILMKNIAEEHNREAEPMDSATLAACAYHYESAMIYYNQKRYKEAITMFAELAQYSYGPALYMIAECYLNGKGLTRNEQHAYKFMTLAAEKGEAKAQYDLYLMIKSGTGTERDLSLAEMWRIKAIDSEEPRALMEAVAEYREAGLTEEANEFIVKAAQQQHPDGLYEYGRMLMEEGKDGTAYIEAAAASKCQNAIIYLLEREHDAGNYKQAYKYARELDLMGNPHGTKRLADYYYHGKGIGRDRNTAMDLYRKASNAGNEDAKEALKELRK